MQCECSSGVGKNGRERVTAIMLREKYQLRVNRSEYQLEAKQSVYPGFIFEFLKNKNHATSYRCIRLVIRNKTRIRKHVKMNGYSFGSERII